MSMIKTIPAHSQPDLSEQPFTQVKVAGDGLRGHDLKDFLKRASHQLADWVRTNPPKAGGVYAHLHALGSGELYGCFFEGAPVETSSGLRRIEDVREGDLVLTHKNRFRKVIKTFTSGYTGKRVTLRGSGLPEPISCTEEHPFWVVRAGDFGKNARCEAYLLRKGKTKLGAADAAVEKAQFVRADQLAKGDFLVVPIRPAANSSDVVADPYFLGVYLSEGCISREYREITSKGKPRRVILSLHKYDDIGMLQRIEAVLGRRITTRQSLTSEVGIRAAIGDNALAAECVTLFGGDSTTKRIPPSVFAQAREWKLRFLAGYLDGDGCVVKTGPDRCRGTIRASTASLNLAYDLHRLMASAGVAASVTKGWNRQRNGCFGSKDLVIYHVSVGRGYTKEILARCTRLAWDHGDKTTKKSGATQIGTNYALVPITSVLYDEVTDEPKFNLEVEEDNSYVAFGVSVHNCNRNADFYSASMLERDHPTFEKYAHVFVDHRNQDPRKSYGIVKKSWYNRDMQRVELIVELNATKEAAERNQGLVAERTLQKLASGIDVAVSQSCKVPGDRCNSCGNWAKTRAQYCTPDMCKYGGCRDNLGRTFDDGFHLYVDNPHCTFFDISDVSNTRGADRTAFITGKVAGDLRVMGGAELAEMLGLVAPAYLLDRDTVSAAGCLRKLAAVRAVGETSPSWADSLAVRAKNKTQHSKEAAFPAGYGSAERHRLLAEMGAAGVILPPAQWLHATSNAPLEKCAHVFSQGVDPQRDLLDRSDLHDVLASQSLGEDAEEPHNRLCGSAEKYAWMSPTVEAHARESQLGVLKGLVPADGSKQAAAAVPAQVRKEACAAYLAYQARILAFHENSENFPLMLSECARHNRGTTV